MKVYIVQKVIRDTWALNGGFKKKELVSTFLTKADAERWIARQERQTFSQYDCEYIIEESELGGDWAVGYDMTNLVAYCPCGNPVDPTENYCSQCGAKLHWDMEKWNKLIAEIDRRRKGENT